MRKNPRLPGLPPIVATFVLALVAKHLVAAIPKISPLTWKPMNQAAGIGNRIGADLGKVIYCAPAASGDGSGSDWDNCATLALALADAGTVAPKIIWAKEGTHSPGVTADATFALVEGVNIYGGFAGDEVMPSMRHGGDTILSGELDELDPTANITAVVTGGVDCILDGLTITKAYGHLLYGGATVINNVIFSDVESAIEAGGAIYNAIGTAGVANMTLKNCTITGVTSDSAIYLEGNQTVMITNPVVTACTSDYDVAGMFVKTSADAINLTITNPDVSGCVLGSHGGAIYYDSTGVFSVVGGEFANNTAGGYGGAIWMGVNARSGVGTISGTIFSGNTGLMGGAIKCSSTTLTVNNCVFSGNESTSVGNAGGAVRTEALAAAAATFNNCVFDSNVAGGIGGAIHGQHKARYSLFIDNSAASGGATHGAGRDNYGNVYIGNTATTEGEAALDISLNSVMKNCIVWNNSEPQVAIVGSITYSGVQGGATGDGNFDLTADPFVNSASPVGADNVWWTADDGLRIAAGNACLTASDTGGEIGAYAA